jgi:hypothetical protein
MDGLGQDSKKLVTKQVPLPVSMDEILGAIRDILAQKSIHSIHVEKDKPIVYQRLDVQEETEPGSDPDISDLSPYEIVRRSDMREFDPRSQGLDGVEPIAVVAWMMVYLERRQRVPAYLLLGDASDFWKWLGWPRQGGNTESFLGMRVVRDIQMPARAFLVCGTEDRWAAFHEVKLLLKGSC